MLTDLNVIDLKGPLSIIIIGSGSQTSHRKDCVAEKKIMMNYACEHRKINMVLLLKSYF